MKIEIDIWDDQADYLVKQWLLPHYKMGQPDAPFASKHPEDVERSKELCAAMEVLFDYMGVDECTL